MPAEPMRDLVVHATLDDAFDGIIRVLGDALRFGTALQTLTLAAEPDGTATASMTLSVPTRIDGQLLAARFARHPVVRDVETEEERAASPSFRPLESRAIPAALGRPAQEFA